MGGGNVIRRNCRSLIHTSIDSETLSPIRPTTPRKDTVGSPIKMTPQPPKTELSASPPVTPKLNPAEPALEKPCVSDSPNNKTTRLGRTIKCNQQPDMIYYK